MTKLSALALANKASYKSVVRTNKKPWKETHDAFWNEVEDLIKGFVSSYGGSDFVKNAKDHGWFGYEIPKCKSGLLGYMRTSFGIQLAALKKEKEGLEITVPIYYSNDDIVKFFRGDFVRNKALEKGYPGNIYKKEHFELIKNN